MANENTEKQGVGSADEKKRDEMARKGEQTVPPEERSFSKDPELAAEAGRKGGEAKGQKSQSEQKDGNSDQNRKADEQRHKKSA